MVISVTGHPRDTLYTSTCFHRLNNQRPTTRRQSNSNMRQSDGNLPYSAIFRQVPLNSAIFCQVPPNSAKFCQDHVPNPIPLRARVDQATKSTICTLSSRFPTFFPYATS